MANQPTNLTTGQVRLSYVHLFKPYANQQGQEPKYSVTILLPKSDIATKQRIDAAINAAVQAGVASKWNGVRPPQITTPIWDGDGVRKNGEPFGPECKGHWVFTASSRQQQAIVDMSLNPIINQTEIYSGIYARVNINFFPFSTQGNRGIGCGLGPVQKTADGEPLGGQMSAEAAFSDSQGGFAPSSPSPAYQPGYPMQPNYSQPVAPQPNYAQPVAPQPNYAQPSYAPPVQPGGYAQPGYPQTIPQGYGQPIAPQPTYPQPGQAVQQFDPITGKPLTGGIMGL